MARRKKTDPGQRDTTGFVYMGGTQGPVVVPSAWGIPGIPGWGQRFAPLLPDGVDVHMMMRMVDGVPHCTELRFVPREPALGVSAKALRDFRLEDWIERACWIASVRPDTPEFDHVDDLLSIRKARARARGGYTDELLQEVADIYAANIDTQPTKAVREQFRVAQSTAQLYVKKARERGFLTLDAPTGGRS